MLPRCARKAHHAALQLAHVAFDSEAPVARSKNNQRHERRHAAHAVHDAATGVVEIALHAVERLDAAIR